jgi:hypothetical protein
MTDRPVAVLAVLGCLVLAGCAGTLDLAGDPASPRSESGGEERADPETDVIGWEDGYWHNESIAVDQSDGLNDTELRAFVARGMARVEYIRDREFAQRVPVSTISRSEYQSGDGGDADSAYQDWNDQVWEALWIVGEETPVADAFAATRGSSVGGFYSPAENEITIITTTPEAPTISNGTLIHELTHALQDQRGVLDAEGLSARTQDGQLATDSVVEGEANYVEDRYNQRCGDGWACVQSPSGGGGALPADFNFGLFVTIFFPYSDGPPWIADLVEREGWSGVDDAFAAPPASSEQVIHHTDEEPAPLAFTDTATGSWERYRGQGVDGADTVGEASIFAMFWYQSRTYDAGVVDVTALSETRGPYDTYDYESAPSTGWGNDRLVPYVNDSGAQGYVWQTVWDSPAEAAEFHDAYLEVLATHDAEARATGTHLVSEGPFADAFRVVRNGSRVTIVNGPTIDALAALRPGLSAADDRVTSPPTTSGAFGTGLGVTVGVLAILGVVLALLTARRR